MGRVTLLVYALLLASVACCLGGNAHAQTCSCKGSMLDHYKGGDSKPLIWTFEPYLVKPGDTDRASWICYLKIVSNESQTEARRINWEVASFYRRFVSPNASAASCATIVGEMKTSPRNGPLYHGIAEHYDTTVREPTEGWKESSVDPKSNIGIAKEIVVVGPNGPLLAQIPVVYFSPIEASFVLDLDTSAAPRRAVIKMVSSVASGKEDELIYEFSNSGNAALRVLVNLPNDGQLSTTVPIVSNPLLLEPGRPLKFIYSTNRPITFQSATVIFYDQPGKEIIGVESAGFYGLTEGKREINTELLRRSLRSGN
jgi:hypothetical protein